VPHSIFSYKLGIGVGLGQVEVQPGQAVLAVDDQEPVARLAEIAHALVAAERLERQLLGREQEHGAGDQRLAGLGADEVADLLGRLTSRCNARAVVSWARTKRSTSSPSRRPSPPTDCPRPA
jgi:hypothetical protein